jgi:hypothetical protein
MPVTLATARTEVRALLDESVANFWTDAQINSWINQGCSDIARRAEILWQEVNMNVTPLVQSYPFQPDFLNVHRAEFTITQNGISSDQTFNLEYRGINQMDEVWGILHALPAAWPQYFTIRGNSVLGFYLMLYPSPGTTGVLTVYYYRQAITVTSDTQNIDTMPGWEDIVYDYAFYKAKRKAQDPQWQQGLQLYEKNLAMMIEKTRNMTDQGEQITSGIPQWPVYAYGDSAANEGW